MPQKTRCGWCRTHPIDQNYHDTEWWIPSYDDAYLFEILILESFQTGLSWFTILCKREGFYEAFDGFSLQKVASWSEETILALKKDSRIVMHEGKIRATQKNAQAFLKVQQEFGSFSAYFWQFTDGEVIDNNPQTLTDIPAKTELSETISKDMKKRGFAYVGPTVIYAYMQAVGMVNDHVENCFVRQK